jgi:threonine/homoserine/homoserine lactone efflux protein
MLKVIGIILIATGVLAATYGDKTMGNADGLIGKLFSWPPGRAKYLKIVIGVALIYAGLKLIAAG